MTVSNKCAWKWECSSTPMHTDLYQKQLHWSLSRNQTRLPMQAEKTRTRSYNPPIATITGRVFKICVALLYNDQEGIFISNNVDDSLAGWFQLLVNPVWVLTGQDLSYFSITCLPHLWGVALLFCFNMSLIDELSSMSVQFQPPSLPIFCRLGCEVWSAWTSRANGAVSKKIDWTTRQGILQNGMWGCPVRTINHKTPLGFSLGQKNNKALGVWPATSTASPTPQLQTSCQTNALDTDGGGLGWIRHKPGRAGVEAVS